jgi:hypothetical protein
MAPYDEGRGPALFIAGSFEGRLAKWKAQGLGMPGAGMNGSVWTLATHDDGSGAALYAAGSFTAGGDAGASVLKRTGTNWAAVGEPFVRINSSAGIRVLRSYDDGSGPALYAGGQAAYLGNVQLGIARWNGAAWSRVGADLSGEVWALCEFDDGTGTALYAGGSSAGAVHRWNGHAWDTAGSWLSGRAQTLAVFNDGSGPALYAGGQFGVTRLYRLNGQAWSAVGGPNSTVWVLVVHDDGSGPALYAAGDFSSVGIPGTGLVARWNGQAWSAVGTGLIKFDSSSVVGNLASVNDASGNTLYAAGQRIIIPGSSVHHRFVKWDGETWSVAGGDVGGPGDSALALKLFPEGNPSALYIGGSFSTVGDPAQPSMRLARWACPDIPPCYPNCDGSTVPPILNVLDFNCFLNAFTAADPYANCDGSTIPPLLNVLDFNCFLNAFTAGCR